VNGSPHLPPVAEWESFYGVLLLFVGIHNAWDSALWIAEG